MASHNIKGAVINGD